MTILSEAHLVSSARQIEPGNFREYTLTWDLSHAGARNLELKLGRLRDGATFKVRKLGDRQIRIEATEPTRGYRINGSPAVDLTSLERDLNRRRE